MMAPGSVLSQPPNATKPSYAWPCTTASIESAISSRLTSENFMPSWFMPRPSDTEIVVNSRGVPPAASTPSLAASTCAPCVMLQGVVSPFWLTTPIIGLAIAASSRPIARMKARCGVRSSPSVVMRERSAISGPLRAAVEDAPHLAGERIGGERLGQQVDVRVEPAVMDDGVARVAGHVEHLDGGPALAQRVAQLPAIHPARKHDIGQQEIDRRRVLHQLERRCAIRRRDHLIAALLQRLDRELVHLRVVLDHQHALAAVEGWCGCRRCAARDPLRQVGLTG